MNNTQPRTINSTAIFIAIIIAAVVVVVIGQAIAGEQFWTLVGGFAVFSVLLVALAWIGIHLFNRYTETVLKRDALRYDHAQAMVKYGLLFNGSEYKELAPPEQDIPVSLNGITEAQLMEFQEDACNLLALSIQLMGENSQQVAPYYKARANDYFKDVAVWTNAVRFLLSRQYASERYKGGKKEGTFLTSGTVRQAWEKMKQRG